LTAYAASETEVLDRCQTLAARSTAQYAGEKQADRTSRIPGNDVADKRRAWRLSRLMCDKRTMRCCRRTGNAFLGCLRSLIASSLLAILGLQLVPSLLALTAGTETNLPACCRRNGRHDCMMGMAERGQHTSREPQFTAPPEKCPYNPAEFAVTHGNAFAPPLAQAIFAGVVAHPATTAQTKSKLRISLNRSRQKRGPPASFSR
jgi:hypothetical protein